MPKPVSVQRVEEGPRPCPFCAYEALLVARTDHDWYVCCQNAACRAQGPRCLDHATALLYWNVRVTTAAGEPI